MGPDSENGDVRLKLSYDESKQELHVTLLEARDLIMKGRRIPSTYAKINLLPTSGYICC